MQHEAEDELEHAKDKAVREVWKAYDDVKVALAKHQAAAALLAASEKAWAATLDSYQHGLATFPDVQKSERNLARARTLDQAAREIRHLGDASAWDARTACGPRLGCLVRKLLLLGDRRSVRWQSKARCSSW
jgi:hypothetical protein